MRTRIIIDPAKLSARARRYQRGFATVLLLASATIHSHAIAATCTATGTGNWNQPSIWSGCGGGVPGAADTARINAVSAVTVVTIPTGVAVTAAAIEFGATGSPTLTVDGALTVGNVVHRANTIDGIGPITVTGTYDWIGNNGPLQGTLRPDGSAPPLTFAPGSTWNLAGPVMPLRRRAVVQQGDAHFSAGGIGCSSTVTWLIASGATLSISHAGNIGSGGVDCRIRNEGTIRKTGTGTFQLTDSRVFLENHGLLDVQAGVFDFGNGGGPTAHSGVFHTASGARLAAPRSATEFAVGTTFEGAGEVRFSGSGGARSFLGDVSFTGPVVLHDQNPDLVAASGATLRFPAGLTWMSGRLRGPGSFVVPAGSTLVLDGPAPKIVGAFAQVRLEGNTRWQGGELGFQSSTTPPQTRLVNAPGADFQVLFRPANMSMGGSDENVFENLGSFTATAAIAGGALTMGQSLRGTIINSGTMVLAGAVSSQSRTWRQSAGQLVLNDVQMQLAPESFNSPMMLEGGALSGNAVLTGAIHNSGALVLPGDVDTVGAIAIIGRYSEGADAAMQLDVNGTALDQHDRFVVTGTPGSIDLRGHLAINRLGGYQVEPADAITLIDAVTAPATSQHALITLDPTFAPVPQLREDRSRVVLARDVLFTDDFELPVPVTLPIDAAP